MHAVPRRQAMLSRVKSDDHLFPSSKKKKDGKRDKDKEREEKKDEEESPRQGSGGDRAGTANEGSSRKQRRRSSASMHTPAAKAAAASLERRHSVEAERRHSVEAEDVDDDEEAALPRYDHRGMPLFLKDPWLVNVEHLGVAAAREPLLIQLNNFALLGALMCGISVAMLMGANVHRRANMSVRWNVLGVAISLSFMTSLLATLLATVMLSQLNVRVMDSEFIAFMLQFGYLGTVTRFSLVACMPCIAASAAILAFENFSPDVGMIASVGYTICGLFVFGVYCQMLAGQTRAMRRLHVRNKLSSAVDRLLAAQESDDGSGSASASEAEADLEEAVQRVSANGLSIDLAGSVSGGSLALSPRVHPMEAEMSIAAAAAAAQAARRVKEYRQARRMCLRAAAMSVSSAGRGSSSVSMPQTARFPNAGLPVPMLPTPALAQAGPKSARAAFMATRLFGGVSSPLSSRPPSLPASRPSSPPASARPASQSQPTSLHASPPASPTPSSSSRTQRQAAPPSDRLPEFQAPPRMRNEMSAPRATGRYMC